MIGNMPGAQAIPIHGAVLSHETLHHSMLKGTALPSAAQSVWTLRFNHGCVFLFGFRSRLSHLRKVDRPGG